MSDTALSLLRKSLGNDFAEFHEHQLEAIDELVSNQKRLLVVQRTGWGKSSVYFISTRLLRDQGYGPTVIISPLLALMRNQIDSAAKYGVRLGAINSSNSRNENASIESALLSDELDAVIVSPEKLADEKFVKDVLMPISDNVGLFVIDEAHCISDWGHDFRPDYKRIVHILKFLPSNLPVLATTATANQRVMDDIKKQLGNEVSVLRGHLTRESLHLQSLDLTTRAERLAWLSENIPKLEGTGIVYAATKRDVNKVSSWLRQNGIASEAYTGGVDSKKRLELEHSLLNNKIKVLVATSALGMGYDKPDLSFVIHYQSPGSVVRYYQEVGRAGRAIPKAYGILMSGKEDDDIQQFFINNAFPKKETVDSILKVLEESDGLKLAEIQSLVNTRQERVKKALKFLASEHPSPIAKNSSVYQRTTSNYELPHENIIRLSELKNLEWQQIQKYLVSSNCLMQYLARSLDDDMQESCGKCANCVPDSKLPTSVLQSSILEATEFLNQVVIEIEPKKQFAPSRTAAMNRFPIYQFERSIDSLKHEKGRALSYWGEAPWGQLALQGKHSNKFDDELVEACTNLVSNQWIPSPMPTWIAYVPSNKHVDLVPSFAKKLGIKLNIPVIDAVSKIKDNKPQKNMENAEYQTRNLDGAFQINNIKQGEPVLLVDDAVDSGWTFTVIAALLIQAGSGPVFPLAITTTSTQ